MALIVKVGSRKSDNLNYIHRGVNLHVSYILQIESWKAQWILFLSLNGIDF